MVFTLRFAMIIPRYLAAGKLRKKQNKNWKKRFDKPERKEKTSPCFTRSGLTRITCLPFTGT